MPRNREEEIILFDYYGELLTSHQKNVLDEYFNEDLSMNEIADNLNISKSAVQDLIKRSINQMKEYEEKLHLIKKDKKINVILDKMKLENDLCNDYAKQIEELL